MKFRLRAQPLIHGDETTVQVLKEKDTEARQHIVYLGVSKRRGQQ